MKTTNNKQQQKSFDLTHFVVRDPESCKALETSEIVYRYNK